jgi:hypothetical protein
MPRLIITCRTMGSSPCGHQHVEWVKYRNEGSPTLNRMSRTAMVAFLRTPGNSAVTEGRNGTSASVYPRKCTSADVLYLTTVSDGTKPDNLEDLPNCQ